VDQVGFVSEKEILELNMMGDELCINASLALASLQGKSGKMKISGLASPVSYVNEPGGTAITMHLPYRREQNRVLFDGIGFVCTETMPEITKDILRNLADAYHLPAFGIAVYESGKLTPWVYVKKTDTLVQESACGSGSIATSIISGASAITQPTGEQISVKFEGDMCTVRATVQEVKSSLILV
jgi:hypothetical protein